MTPENLQLYLFGVNNGHETISFYDIRSIDSTEMILVKLKIGDSLMIDKFRETRILNEMKKQNAAKDHIDIPFEHIRGGIGHALFFKKFGMKLDEFVEANGAIKVPNLRVVTFQLTNALNALGKMGLYHGNVHPKNVLIDDDFGVKLTGFENAMHCKSGQNVKIIDEPCRPPELSENIPYSYHSDVYSLGVVLLFAYHAGYPIYIQPDNNIPGELRKICDTLLTDGYERSDTIAFFCIVAGMMVHEPTERKLPQDLLIERFLTMLHLAQRGEYSRESRRLMRPYTGKLLAERNRYHEIDIVEIVRLVDPMNDNILHAQALINYFAGIVYGFANVPPFPPTISTLHQAAVTVAPSTQRAERVFDPVRSFAKRRNAWKTVHYPVIYCASCHKKEECAIERINRE